MSLVFGDKTSVSVKTLEPTEVFLLLKSGFYSLLEKNKESAEEIRYIAEKRKYEDTKNM